MQDETAQALHIIIKDLNTLMIEIENNPRLSSWVVRQVLKSIKDKAESLAGVSGFQQEYSAEGRPR